MLVPGKWGGSEDCTSIEDDQVLESEFSKENNEELEVVEESLEDVEVSPSEFSAVKLVEQVHKDECVEDHGVVFKFVLSGSSNSWVFKFFGSVEINLGVVNKVVALTEPPRDGVEHDDQDDKLIGGLTNDVSPHDWENNLISLLLSVLL